MSIDVSEVRAASIFRAVMMVQMLWSSDNQLNGFIPR
jgi:hypothetical protein